MNIGKNYFETRILTASPEQLVVIMYEETVKALSRAKKAISSRNFSEANEQLHKAQMIIAELMSALDFDYEDIANNLFNIYRYVYQQIVLANTRKDAKLVNEIERLLSLFTDTWKEAAKRIATEVQSQARTNVQA